MQLLPVIPSQCAHWRGNPLSFWGKRIATPASRVRNDEGGAFCNALGAFAARADVSVFRGPILNREAVYAGELPLVVGDKGQPLRPGVRRDQQIVRPDQAPLLR